MSIFLIIAFLFFVGSISGWGIEVVFRRFFSGANPKRRWINPGFLTGPYLPLYGFSLCILYLLARIDVSAIGNKVMEKVVLFIVMATAVTVIEYIAGIIFINKMKIKLWDYTDEWGNIKGIICPKFSFFWTVLSAIYYFAIHPYIQESLVWLASHLTFSFVMGFFYGIFCIDLVQSLNIMTKVREFATEKEIIVRYEYLKESIQRINEEQKAKRRFMFNMKSESFTLKESLKNYLDKEELRFVDNYKLIKKERNKKQKK